MSRDPEVSSKTLPKTLFEAMPKSKPSSKPDSIPEATPGAIPGNVDVVIIGGGAAGLMCAITAGQRGRSVLLVDHANKIGKKILMSGGGRCNFTNRQVEPTNFLSRNPHFCKSALSRYTQWDFIALVDQHAVPYHEKTLGQLFCDNKAQDILQLLVAEAQSASVDIRTRCEVTNIKVREEGGFSVATSLGRVTAESLVIASGGLSIPTMGASGFGYQVARDFGLQVLPTSAGLVPFTLSEKELAVFAPLSGTAVDVRVSCNGQSFSEAMLFTHRGLSGPAILQISSYWQTGDVIEIDLLPNLNLTAHLKTMRQQRPKAELRTLLAELFTKKLAQCFCELWSESRAINQFNDNELDALARQLHHWQVKPNGTEGYRTAEVTLGGVDTDELSSKTLEAKKQAGLYFVGEVVDVTGHLGGFNFQWAWASGYAAGSYV